MCNSFFNRSTYIEDNKALQRDRDFQEINFLKTKKRCLSFLLKLLEKKNIFNILEIGCGVGPFLSAAKELGLNAKGVDINPYVIKSCQKRNLSVECRLLSQVDCFSERFDLIISDQVLEHIDSPGEFIQIIKKQKSKNTIIYIGCPLSRSVFLTKLYIKYPWLPGSLFFDNDVHINHISLQAFNTTVKSQLSSKECKFYYGEISSPISLFKVILRYILFSPKGAFFF